ncbi:MAG: IreB family regulatory phosphoprotein [Oscillospiraceae bacterium]
MDDRTISFSIHKDKEQQVKSILTTVYDALRQKGYNPINQIVGYILSEDPTYITTHNNARSLIRKIDRDELLQILVKSYLAN